MPVMLGQSKVFGQMLAQLHCYSRCDVQILLEGETGTGKELAAREIHYASERRERPFVPVNCGALPDTLIENELFGHERGAYTDAKSAQPGLIEHARGGTLFLDEVDSLSIKAQVTLLRFLENNEYRPVGGGVTRFSNARIVAATNASLETQVAAGLFRRDLQHRLNALHVRLPPLRERGGDVPMLAEHFLRQVSQSMDRPAKHWSAGALRVLDAHDWPGNVRELENVVLRSYLGTDGAVIDAFTLDGLITSVSNISSHSPASTLQDDGELHYVSAKHNAMSAFERSYLFGLMTKTSGNITAAARLSGTDRRQLGKLLKKHCIETGVFR
ncbi:sigma-54 dependent transcriptional regulator [Rhodanobacter sp. AS-Z3]|uniref:sigma 54-interacting transcriptional regulator n=1 Tax=Rhodanobacter sp. AS-Z3 TaxID=3031330 RepID=UPI0024783EDC|nr:sigma-54 dependent transcriptional regulator [Rhodanobacter sp. AS-Z3]WEN13743.1 sigma-54 dependent transcriptional regulator [Rhodanobacter sp. AS-Z3]